MQQEIKIGNTYRVAYLDYARILCAFLVIFGHFYSPVSTQFRTYIYEFHVPFFFLVSGMLHKQRDFKTSIVKYFKLLLVPFVTFNFLYLLYSSVYYEYSLDNFWDAWGANIWSSNIVSSWMLNTFRYAKSGLIQFIHSTGCIDGPSWFLIPLLYCKIGIDIFLRAKLKRWLLICFVVLFIVTLKFVNYIWIKNALMALPLFGLGYVCKTYMNKVLSSINPYLGIIICGALVYVLMLMNGSISMFTVRFGIHSIFISLPLFYITGISGSFMLLFISKLCGQGNKYSLITANALLTILCLQYFFILPLSNIFGYDGNFIKCLSVTY